MHLCLQYIHACRDQLKAEGRDHLVEAMLCAMEEVWGKGFEDGLNPELEYLDHLQVRNPNPQHIKACAGACCIVVPQRRGSPSGCIGQCAGRLCLSYSSCRGKGPWLQPFPCA